MDTTLCSSTIDVKETTVPDRTDSMDAQHSSSDPDKIEDFEAQSIAPNKFYGRRQKETSCDTYFEDRVIKTDNTSMEPINRSISTNNRIDPGGIEYNARENSPPDQNIGHDSSGYVNTTEFEGITLKKPLLVNISYM